MNNRIIYWGATGQLVVLHDFLANSYNAIAIFDRNRNLDSPLVDVPIFFGEEEFLTWYNRLKDKTNISFLVAIGGPNGNDRVGISQRLKTFGMKPIIAKHPSAIISRSAEICEGAQILMGACIGARARIGKYAIVNTKASVDHECKIGDGCHIAPGATLAGSVEIGVNSFVGVGAVILPRIKIGANSIIGAGSVVTKDIPESVVAFGNPARIRRQIN